MEVTFADLSAAGTKKTNTTSSRMKTRIYAGYSIRKCFPSQRENRSPNVQIKIRHRQEYPNTN